MTSQLSIDLAQKTWLIYLRKSRQDNPDESVAEVLSKHETILQDWARRELGREIPDDCIYREVVSGESLSDRIEIQKLLSRIEDPGVAGVAVVEPQRLSRGDLEDCGKLISTFLYTSTLVATPAMIYSMSNKMERRFFQDELMRGRDYLDYTKEILLRGRIAAVKRGCYISREAPYGYNKVVIGKDHTLEPNENADVVRMIFELYVNQGLTYYEICCKLNGMKIPSPRGGQWQNDTIRKILSNIQYTGKVSYNKVRRTIIVENGMRIEKKLMQQPDDVIIAEGKHAPIIESGMFQAAQQRIGRNPAVRHNYDLQNPFSGVLYCAGCGRAISRHPYKQAGLRMECRSKPKCCKSVKYEEVEHAIIAALEDSELPNLQHKAKNGAENSAELQKRMLSRLEKQMDDYRQQEAKQFDLLETGVYTLQRFKERNDILRKKIEECDAQIQEARTSIPKTIDYAERVSSLEQAISALKDKNASAITKNKLLKSIVNRIDFSTGETGYNYTEIKLNIALKL